MTLVIKQHLNSKIIDENVSKIKKKLFITIWSIRGLNWEWQSFNIEYPDINWNILDLCCYFSLNPYIAIKAKQWLDSK